MTNSAPPARNIPRDVEYLRRTDLFTNLDTETLTAIAQAGRVRRTDTGGYLFHQGDPASVLYVLTSGRVKLVQLTPDGEQVILRVVGPGETFGAGAALGLEDAVYPASAQATAACRALAWDGPTILDLMRRFPDLAINALRVLAARVHEFQDRYRELATERVEQRVARALLRLARQVGRKVEGGVLIDLTLTRQDLAEMTGTKRFTISRIFSDWEQQGVIESGRERVLIRQPHRLVVIAEDLPANISHEPED